MSATIMISANHSPDEEYRARVYTLHVSGRDDAGVTAMNIDADGCELSVFLTDERARDLSAKLLHEVNARAARAKALSMERAA